MAITAGHCVQHYQGPANVETDHVAGVTFTATTAADGSLLVGSSREFAAFNSDADEPGMPTSVSCCSVSLHHQAALPAWNALHVCVPIPTQGQGYVDHFHLPTFSCSSSLILMLLPPTMHGTAVIRAILDRASAFIPKLKGLSEAIHPRVGLRPYCTANRPLMGPIPGCPGLYVAAGHEGSGLTLAPASADIMAAHVLGLHQGMAAADSFTPADAFRV